MRLWAEHAEPICTYVCVFLFATTSAPHASTTSHFFCTLTIGAALTVGFYIFD